MLEGISKLNNKASNVIHWNNLASLHLTDKTRAIYFGSSVFVDRLDKQNLPGVDIGGGIIIPFVQEVKSLGVILDCKLSWEPHVISVEKKVNRILYTLRFIRDCTSETIRKRLVQALITPHLDYCSVVLLDTGHTLKERIQRLSNIGLRYIFGISRDTHITPFRKKLNWLSTDSRRLYFCNVIIYKILRMDQPVYLTDIFQKHKPKETARGQSITKELTLTDTIKGRGSNSFQILGVSYWNSIPPSIRSLPSLSRFKSALFKHLHINEYKNVTG